MPTGARVVADTNVLVSRLILPQSIPAKVIRQAELESVLLFSDATMSGLADVLSRPKSTPTLAGMAASGSWNT